MKPVELKVARIGNSRGVRLPASTLERYDIGETIIMEERLEGILLRPHGLAIHKLSWAETAERMSAAQEDWSEWDTALDDGLDQLPWDETTSRRVAEPRSGYRRKSKE
jgi:antitoxin component of MazEF toxin-antitoxin module